MVQLSYQNLKNLIVEQYFKKINFDCILNFLRLIIELYPAFLELYPAFLELLLFCRRQNFHLFDLLLVLLKFLLEVMRDLVNPALEQPTQPFHYNLEGIHFI